jgi:hypothetical protein
MFIGLLAALLVAALAATQPFYAAGQREKERDDNNWDNFQEKEEINQTYQLAPGAKVDVSGINGSVEIETSNSNAAEVHIIRSARTKEDLQYHKIIIEPSANSLVIRGENNKEREREGRNRDVRHQVLLKLPRQIQLGASGVNGRVTVGEIDGPINISGINGRVEVAQAAGYSTLSGINGRVKVTLTQMNERGVSISGINGGVELAFTDSLNADLDVSGINGSVDAADFPMTIQGKMERHSFRAKIGSGGAPINVSGVNGKVRITRAGRAG